MPILPLTSSTETDLTLLAVARGDEPGLVQSSQITLIVFGSTGAR